MSKIYYKSEATYYVRNRSLNMSDLAMKRAMKDGSSFEVLCAILISRFNCKYWTGVACTFGTAI